MEKKVKCFCCGGDGKETCSNPDHDFLSMMDGVFLNANESACPCCGHDPEHKIKKWVNGKFIYNKCWECDGTGELSEDRANKLADEYGYDDEFQYI